jgi:Arc/MetJ-type ribon-helix-helix transcriptional regulator
MTITLSEETQKLLEDRMKLGGYSDADETVRALLEGSIEQDDHSPETLAAIQQGIADADAGGTRPWSEVSKELFERYRQK